MALLLALCVIPANVFAANTQPDQNATVAPNVAIDEQVTIPDTTADSPSPATPAAGEEPIDLPQLNTQEVVTSQPNVADMVQTQTLSGKFYYTDIEGGVSITGCNTSDAEIVIPDTLDGKKVIEIGSYAFYGQTSRFVVGNNVKTIKASAFTGYLMSKIVIPATTTVIEPYAFPSTLYTTLRIYGKKGSYAETYAATLSNARFIDVDQAEPTYFYENVSGGVKILAYNGADSVLSIPATLDGKSVVAIGSGAFKNNDFLTEVNIPDSVTTLDYEILRDCDNLVKLTLGTGITAIPASMAENCLNLKEVIFKGPVISIGSNAFYQCAQLQISKLPDTLETIGSSAFFRCKNLTNLTIPDKTTTVGTGAFVYCEKLENLTMGNSLTTLNTYAFGYCDSLKSVTFPKSLTTIKDGRIFVGCPALTKVVIPDTTTLISSNIFEKSPLTTIYGSKGSYAQSYATTYGIPFVVNGTNTDVSVLYRTHVQNDGWQDWRVDGAMSGTSARSLRLEGIEIKLDQQDYDLAINYATHVQDYGWQDWVKNGTMSGTSQKALRLEAIRIKLSGADAAKFDVYYRVHAQNVGWMGWAKNGADAGTAGYAYRLEGIEIKVLPKGSPAPGTLVDPFLQKK